MSQHIKSSGGDPESDGVGTLSEIDVECRYQTVTTDMIEKLS